VRNPPAPLCGHTGWPHAEPAMHLRAAAPVARARNPPTTLVRRHPRRCAGPAARPLRGAPARMGR
jgi:hypothetical protein